MLKVAKTLWRSKLIGKSTAASSPARVGKSALSYARLSWNISGAASNWNGPKTPGSTNRSLNRQVEVVRPTLKKRGDFCRPQTSYRASAVASYANSATNPFAHRADLRTD